MDSHRLYKYGFFTTLILLMVTTSLLGASQVLIVRDYGGHSSNVEYSLFKYGHSFDPTLVTSRGWRQIAPPAGVWYYKTDAQPQWVFRSTSAPDERLLSEGYLLALYSPSGTWYSESSHNLETNCYANYVQYQEAGGASIKAASPSMYIALTTNSTAVQADGSECVLNSEITANNLGRAIGAITLNNSALSNKVSVYKVVVTFTASGGTTTVQKAGITYLSVASCAANTGASTAKSNGCYIAITALPAAATLTASDQLTVTWTSTYTGT